MPTPASRAPRRIARFADFELEVRSAELRQRSGGVICLAEQPFQVLLVLLEHQRDVVLREDIRHILWPNNTIVEFEHSINAAVNRLRQLLGDSAEKPRYIETLARRGYRWMVPVEWLEGPATLGAPEAPPDAHPATHSLIGRKISHYRLLEVIAGGGMGVVYKAEDVRLSRCVALKLLGEEFSGSRRAVERFEREAQILSSLDHPNIGSIFDVAGYEGRPFIVMPLLQGHTLRQRIESAPPGSCAFTLIELLDVALATLSALEAAHQQGIIHRDVKPANIFVTVRGEIKLLDFGLAVLVEGDAGCAASEDVPRGAEGRASHLTLTGTTMGTASYMAPEQVRRGRVDARTDLFSFGVVLFEMATGRRPFQGSTLELIHEAILTGVPPSPGALNPTLPGDFAAVIDAALEKEPARRFQSAREIITRLEKLRAMLSRKSPEPIVTPARARRRAMMIAGGIGISIALLMAGSAALRSLIPQSRPVQAETLHVQRLTDSGRVENVAISRDGRYVAYAQREQGGVALWLREVAKSVDVQVLPPVGQAAYEGLTFSPGGEALYFVRPAASDAGFKYLYAMPAAGGPTRLLVKDIDSPISFSPDGRSFVYTRGIPSRNSTEVRIASADGSGNRLLTTVPHVFAGFQPGAAWAPDGRTIALAVRHLGGPVRFALYTVDVTDGRIAQVLPSPSFIGRALWLPEGKAFLAVLGDRQDRGQLWSISYPKAVRFRLTNDPTDYDLRPDLTGNANALAAIARTMVATLWTIPAAEPSQAQQLTTLAQRMAITAAPDGRLLGVDAGSLWTLGPNGRQRERLTELDIVSWWPTICGRSVVVAAARNGTTELVRFDTSGSPLTRLAVARAGELNGPSCSPDGKYVYYFNMGERQTIWRVAADGGSPREIATVRGEGLYGRMSFSSDGRAIAYPYEEYTPSPQVKLAVLPAEGGPPVRLIDLTGLEGPEAAYASTLLSSDGQSLQYILPENGAENIWEQPLVGGERRQLTHFTTGRIFDFSRSPDGSRLLLVQGEVSSDAVLLSGLRSIPGEH